MPTPIERLTDKLAAEGKQKLTNTTSNAGNAQGVVLGTFDKTYPVTAIERERQDGVTLVNLSPECRVFICGAEVTKDVISVDTNFDDAANGNCNITLSNPRGKYNVDITDLIGEANKGKWREDKDILQAYDYDWLQKHGSAISNSTPGLSHALKTGSNSNNFSAAFDKVGRNTVESDIINSINLLTNSSKDKTIGITRMLYEIKHHSNVSKKVGEVIFDFRDPIFIFYKGRFSSYWYFGFTGIVSGIDHTKAYSSNDIITIQGNDPLYIYKRKKHTDQGSVVRSGGGETAVKGVPDRNFKVPKGEPGTFDTLVKVMFITQNSKQVKLIENNHFYYTSANTFTDSSGVATPPYNTSNTSRNLEKYMDVFRIAHEFKKGVNNNQTYLDGMMFREFPLRSVSSSLIGSVAGLVGSTVQLVKTGLDLTTAGLDAVMNPGSLLPLADTGTMQNPNSFTNLTNNELSAFGNTIDTTTTKVGGKILNKLDSKLQSVSKTTKLGGELTEAVASQIGIEAGKQTNFESWFKKDKPYLADPDCFNLGPWNDIYLQYNEIQIEEFDEANIKPFYDSSARYWTKDYSLKSETNLLTKVGGTLIGAANEGLDKLTGKSKLGTAAKNLANSISEGFPFNNTVNPEKTGWECKSGFGVCGIHPALTYEFINNFHRIKDVYDAAIDEKTGKPDLLDSVVVTPLEKIKEMVLGSPTEITAIDSSKKLGSQRNYFRPRLFFLWPKKFRKRDKNLWTIGELLLTDESITSSYDIIEKLTNDEEYCVYCSPMGDIFIEPIMYDFHPTKFIDKIEERNIVYDKKDIYFRTFINSVEGDKVVYRKDEAFFFNTKANHPLFITQKDTMRVTETLRPGMIRTSVIVQGSDTGGQGMLDAALAESMNTLRYFTIHQQTEGMTSSKGSVTFQPGMYFADGFPNAIRSLSDADLRKKLRVNSRVDELLGFYEETLLDTLLNDKADEKIYSLITEATRGAEKLSKEPSKIFAHSDVASVYEKLKTKYTEASLAEKEKYQISGATAPFKDLTLSGWILLSFICPNIHSLLEYFTAKDKKSKTTLSYMLQVFIQTYNIKTANDLASMKIRDVVEAFTIQKRSGSSQPVQSSTDTRSEGTADASIAKELSHAYEMSLLAASGANSYIVKGLHDEVAILAQDKTEFPILTRGHLKVLEKQGLYNPNADYVAKYGYNPGPVIQNSAISNGAEAVRYAKSVFTRMTSQAYSFNIEMIGRPELWLNRPHYLEDKYAIGLLTTFSIHYGIEQPFTSNVTLSYIRRNAITYSYTLDELDTVASPTFGLMPYARPETSGITASIGNLSSSLTIPESGEIFNAISSAASNTLSYAALSPTSEGLRKVSAAARTNLKNTAQDVLDEVLSSKSHSNSYFNQKALKYFQQLGTVNKTLVPATDEFFNTGGISSGWIRPGDGVIGQTIANSVARFTPTIIGNPYGGGLYVAHDCIGHINYNESVYSARTDSGTLYENSEASSGESPTTSKKLGQDTLTTSEASTLENMMIEVHNAFKKLQQLEKDLATLWTTTYNLQNTTIPQYEEELTKSKEDLATAITNYNNTAPPDNAKYARDKNKYAKEVSQKTAALFQAKVQLNEFNDRLKKDKATHKTFAETIYNGTVSYDDMSASRITPIHPYAKEGSTSSCLLQKLYNSIPEYSYFSSGNKTKIRSHWKVLDDRDLSAKEKSKKLPLYLENTGAIKTGAK